MWAAVVGGSLLGWLILVAWVVGRGYLRAAVLGPAHSTKPEIATCHCYCMSPLPDRPGYSGKLFQEDIPNQTIDACQALHVPGSTCSRDDLIGQWAGCELY